MKQNNLVTTFRDLTSGPCRKVNIVRMILLYVKPIVVTCFYVGKFSSLSVVPSLGHNFERLLVSMKISYNGDAIATIKIPMQKL